MTPQLFHSSIRLPTPPSDNDTSTSPGLQDRAILGTSCQRTASPSTLGNVTPPDLDTLARRLFYKKYVYVSSDQDIETAWSFDYGNGCLRASVEAVGYIEIGRKTPNRAALEEAEHRFVRALQLTNEALCSDEWMDHDSTLLAVNVLAIFETISTHSEDVSGGWTRHVMGAAALLQGRGPDQFLREMGGQLFIQNVWNLSWVCIWKHEAFPEYIRNLQDVASRHIINPQDRHWRYHCLQLQLVDLYASRPRAGTLCTVQDARRIVTLALHLESQFTSLEQQDPRGWRYTVLEAQGTAVFAGQYHIYGHFHTAQMWNGIRCARIMLADLMARAVTACHTSPPSGYLDDEQISKLAEIPTLVSRMQEDILASVPQHVGSDFPTPGDPLALDDLWSNFAQPDQAMFRFIHSADPEVPRLRQNGGYCLQVPIYIAGAADRTVHGQVRSFAIKALDVLQESYGVQLAKVLSQRLTESHGRPGYGLGQEHGLFYARSQ